MKLARTLIPIVSWLSIIATTFFVWWNHLAWWMALVILSPILITMAALAGALKQHADQELQNAANRATIADQ